jgi:hypothetical protein
MFSVSEHLRLCFRVTALHDSSMSVIALWGTVVIEFSSMFSLRVVFHLESYEQK